MIASIIIPTVPNREIKLKRALSSIQELETDFEIVIAAQRAGFKLLDIKEEFPHLDIKIILHDAEGNAATNRNIALAQAVGEYVAFLDDDDEYVPGKLANQIQAMKKTSTNWSFSSYWLVDEQRDQKRRFFSARTMIRGMIDFEENCAIATPTVIIKRDLLIKNNLKFDSTLSVREDIDLWQKLFKLEPMLYIPQALVVVNRSTASSYQVKKSQKKFRNSLSTKSRTIFRVVRSTQDKADALRGVTHIVSSS